MGPVSAEIEIDVPRQRAFEAIADLSLRPAFTDHFLSDFHLTRIEPTGVGAGARFRIAVRPRRVWMDTTIVEDDAPHRLVEHGRGGRANRIPSITLWELTEGPGALTKVRVSYWTEPSNPIDRGLELLSGASIPYERRWREALRRLREQLESGELGAQRLAVAGGNPHATGIP
ncbi:MAG TPA: SRPBCC family protein [Solirubrobacterales bacterium]|nr:SRPBCC family protein [Solirubrobacterales bacterium]